MSSVDGTGSADNPVTDQSLEGYQAVIVDQDLYVQSDGSMVIKNLTAPGTGPGQTGLGNLIVTNTAEDKEASNFKTTSSMKAREWMPLLPGTSAA